MIEVCVQNKENCRVSLSVFAFLLLQIMLIATLLLSAHITNKYVVHENLIGETSDSLQLEL